MKNYFIKELRLDVAEEKFSFEYICGCYVDTQRERLAIYREKLQDLNKEDRARYLAITKKSMSGTVGRALCAIPFIEPEKNMVKAMLDDILQSGNGKMETDPVFEHIAATYPGQGNFLILITNAHHNVLKRTRNGIIEGSDETFDYLVLSICPVVQEKPNLTYFDKTKNFASGVLDWIAEQPILAAIYPNREKRDTDKDSIVLYVSTGCNHADTFSEICMRCDSKYALRKGQEAFNDLVSSALPPGHEEALINGVLNQVAELKKSKKKEADSPLSKADIKEILTAAGADETGVEAFDKRYDELEREKKLMNLTPSSLKPQRSMSIKSDNVSITIKEDGRSLYSLQNIDGHKCIVIRAEEGMTVNGIKIGTDN